MVRWIKCSERKPKTPYVVHLTWMTPDGARFNAKAYFDISNSLSGGVWRTAITRLPIELGGAKAIAWHEINELVAYAGTP